ncbi:MAG: hypothetical protein FE834_09010, partial [Gammaproteobacteria bacterium]|nr:hypothetical protein [Gammaproteobacteria bacterium]
MKIFNIIIILIGITTLTACGGGGSSNSDGGNDNPPVSKSARILDSAVEGLGYSIDGGAEQYTNNAGRFSYLSSDHKITFKIGGLTLKKEFSLSLINNADRIVFPTDLVGVARNNANQPEVIKILQVLQSLDEDRNPDNGIKITPDMRANITIVADIATISANDVVIQANRNLITEQGVVAHFKKTLKKMFGLVFENNNIVSVAENQTVAITLKAESDNNNSTVQYTISGDDSGSFTVNTNTGVVAFKTAPDFENKPSYTFTAKAENGLKIITQTVTINITNVNDAPTITSTAPTTATEDTSYAYTPTATDVDSDTLTWSLSDKPTNMTFSPTTGEINWMPLEGITTSGEITLTVTDGQLTTAQKFTITVASVNDAPTITSTAPTVATEDTLYTYTPTAT